MTAGGATTAEIPVPLEEARLLVAGALGTKRTGDRLTADRFTPKQRAFYARDPLWTARTGLGAGVRLGMLSDTASVAFDYAIEYADRDWFRFDLLVNGAFAASFGEDRITRRTGRVRFNIPRDRPVERIEILFPHTLAVAVSNLCLSRGASCTPCPRPKGRLLCLGDSILQGMDARHPIHALAHAAARFLDLDLLNQSVGGLVFDPGTLDPDPAFEPDTVLVAYGTNDWDKCADFAAFEANVTAYVERLVALFPAAAIQCITPIWRADHATVKATGTLNGIRGAVTAACAPYGRIRVIPGESLVPPIPARFDDRGIHPDDTGHLHYALNVLRRMRAADGPASPRG